MNTAVVYARYSCEKQREESIISQVRDCEQFAKQNGLTIVDKYVDEAISGRSDNRPAFQRMIMDASTKTFSNIIVWKGDRFSRNRADASKYKNLLKGCHVRVLSVTEPNIEGPESILMDGINEAYAEYYSAELAVKVTRGMKENVREGKFNGGWIPYGYEKNTEGHLVINEEEAPIVRELFQTFVYEDLSIRAISLRFTQKGYVNRYGKPFIPGILYKMLRNKKYTGKYSFQDQVNNCIPRIIDDEMLDRSIVKMNLHHKNRQSYKSEDAYILSGKLICGECRSKMIGVSGKSKNGDSKYKYYQCVRNRHKQECNQKPVPKKPLEDMVIKALAKVLATPKIIDGLIEKISSHMKNSDPELIIAQNTLKTTEKKITNIYDAIESGVPLKGIKERLEVLEDAKNKQTINLDRLKRSNFIITEEQLRYYFDEVAKMDLDTNKARKYLIQTFVNSIYFYKDGRAHIYLNYRGGGLPFQETDEVRLNIPSVHQKQKEMP
jgi:site-specific DNA recombinase